MGKDVQAQPKYDVALSFLNAHLALAQQISDGLTDRLTTFVYSREQPGVVGRNTDGVEAFNNVFRYDSRVCVILHSDGWGKKGMTHIEEAAMKERALDDGWDFLIVVCLDNTKPPKWIPSTKIWYGFKEYGLKGLLAAIDMRVTELGGRPKQDSVLERAAREERERDFAKRKELFAHSNHGLKAATEEVSQLFKLLETRVEQLAKASPSLGLKFEQNSINWRNVVAAVSSNASFVMYWQPVYGNSLTDAAIVVREFGGRFVFQGIYGGPERIADWSVTPTIDYANRVVWEVEEGKPLASEKLLDFFFERLLNHQSKDRRSAEIDFGFKKPDWMLDRY